MPIAAWAKPDQGGLTQQIKGVGAKVGVTSLYRAPVGTARPTIAAPNIGINGGWLDLGLGKTGSFKDDFTRKTYDLMSGVPETLKQQFVIGVTGKINFDILEPTALAFKTASGHGISTAKFLAAPVTANVIAVPTAATTNGTFEMVSVTGFAVNDEVEVNLASGKEYTTVFAVDAVNNALQVYPLVSVKPTANVTVKRVDSWDVPQGTSTIETMSLFGITSFTDGSQMTMYVNKASADGVRDTNDGKSALALPVQWNAYGYTDTGYSTSGPVVAIKSFLIPAAAIPLTITPV